MVLNLANENQHTYSYIPTNTKPVITMQHDREKGSLKGRMNQPHHQATPTAARSNLEVAWVEEAKSEPDAVTRICYYT